MSTDATKARILIVDDEREHAEVMTEALRRQGYRMTTTYSLAEARRALDNAKFDVVVTDLVMEGERDGLDLIRLAKGLTPPPPVILVTAHADIPTCKAALADGAYDYIEKPLDLDDFRAQVRRAAEKSELLKQNQILAAQVLEGGNFEGIIGRSQVMQQVLRLARQVAASDISVLITGESGTGKELIARAIHNNSNRRKNRLVAINSAGMPEGTLEDELFGHVRGAFTGANTERKGHFETANGGTIMLDEIGDMPIQMQAKLLRVLENGEIMRLGSSTPIRVDVRLITATNRDLTEMVADKTFREDLYFRIKGVEIHLPPLRERRDDIPLLVHYFLKRAAEKYNRDPDTVTLDPEAQQALMGYTWPGNIRELGRVIENVVVLAADGTIRRADLPPEISPRTATSAGGMSNLVGISMQQAELELIRNTLKMTEGNREKAAKILGIGERTLYRKIKEFGL